MTLKNTILVLLLLPLVVLMPKPVIAEPIEIVNPLELTRDGKIQYFSTLYGANINIVKKVIECESGGEHKTVGDSGYSRGIFQFQKSTFYRMAKIFGEELDYNSEYDQLKLGIWAMSKPELAREWTTYVAIQKGGSYSFYSRQLDKHFTVVCKL
jgi:hypothetical protein